MFGTRADITKRKQIDGMVTRLEFLYSMIDTAEIGFNLLDSELWYLEANATSAHSTGLPAEQVVVKTIYEVVPYISGPLPGRPETIIHYHSYHIPVMLLTGAPGIVAIAVDITTHKLEEERTLRESERKFRLVAETIQDVFWMNSPGIKELIYISPGYKRIWGKSTQSLYKSPRTFQENIPPQDLQGFLDIIERYHSRGIAYECEYRIILTNGTTRWNQERGYPITDELGKVSLMTGICTDISERKRMEEELLKKPEFRVP